MPDFTDLQLRIFPRDGDAYPIELTIAGEQHTCGELVADVLPWAIGSDPATDGQRLFSALFATRDLYAAWTAAQKSASQRRVRMWLDAQELHVLPWELLHDGQTFLAAGGATPFSRYVPTSAPWGSAESTRPVRVLVAIANPDDLDTYNLAPLDVNAERSVIPAGVDFLDPPVTLARIEEALQQGYTALHFVGHGVFSQKRQEAALYLEDTTGRTVPTPGADFAAMLTRLAQPPRLIFLSACQSATPATSRAYLGLGVELVTAGVPAVVAMRETIAIAAAQALSRTFYARLMEHGQVDLALNEARSHLLTAHHPDAAIPALWMRLCSGRLWEDTELATQSGNLPPIINQATMIGDGALAQGNNNTVISARAVNVGKNVGGSVITGDQHEEFKR